MLELTADNALAYLRSTNRLDSESARVDWLGGGVSNAVLRIETPRRRFILKQSRPQLRTREDWFSNLDRVYREQEVMQFLHPLLPPPAVPEVLFVDRPNYVFAMSHAPDDALVWKEKLLAGEADPIIGERAGQLLGRLHDVSGRNLSALEPFRDPTVFVQLRVDPFYRRVQERRPEVAAPVQRLIDRMANVKEALCHGDYTPKNLLAAPRTLTLVDYETAHCGDPTMDLGLFLSHLLLKALKHRNRRQVYFDLTGCFWHGYQRGLTFRPVDDWEPAGTAHCGACVLARIDGTSPVDYLPEEPKREVARRLGRRLLLDPIASWNDALAVAEEEFAALQKG